MKLFAGIFIAAIIILGGAVAYHDYNAPQLFRYDLELSITPSSSDIGNLTITNGESYHFNVSGSYFNITLTGFVNYTVTFSYDVAYGSYYNTTAHIYLQSNLSVSFKTSLGSATQGPIYIK